MTRQSLRVGVAFVASLVAGAAVAAPAAAQVDPEGGRWYYTFNRVAEFHDQGVDGSGVTIAIIDSAINLEVSSLRNANVDVHEPAFCADSSGTPLSSQTTDQSIANHGTAVTGIVAGTGEGADGHDGMRGVAPGARVIFYGIGASIALEADGAYNETPCLTADGEDNFSGGLASTIVTAVDAGADIISISLGTTELDPVLIEAIAQAHRAGVIVLAATSNRTEGLASGMDYPVGLNGVVGVRAHDAGGGVPVADGFTVTDKFTDVAAPGVDLYVQGYVDGDWNAGTTVSGSSLATPFTAAALALAMQKYPEATPAQLLQSLIRNTGIDSPHEPVFDAGGVYGYGVVDLISLLADDPTAYEDTNPFLVELSGDDAVLYGPTIEQVNADAAPTSPSPTEGTASPEPSGTSATAGPDDAAGDSRVVWLIAAGVVGVAVIAVIAVVIVRGAGNRGK